jgi:DNA polymerase III delta subunit
MNYALWNKKRQVKQLTWLCGSETTLVEEVIDHVRHTLAPSRLDFVVHQAGITRDREIWASASQYPLGAEASRLVLVRDAERIENWDPLETWILEKKSAPTVHLLLVFNEQDFNTEREAYALCRDNGSIIKCNTPNERDLLEWIMRRGPLDSVAGSYLLTRTGNDLGRAANVARKVQLFEGQAGADLIDALCAENIALDFVDLLVSLEKTKALVALEALSPAEYSRTIGLLDSRLDTLVKLHRLLRGHMTVMDIARDVNRTVPLFLARLLMPYARHYDAKRVLRCQQVMNIVDDSVRRGARIGAMESLVLLW